MLRITRSTLALLPLLAPDPARAQFAVDPAVGIWVNAAELSQLPMSDDAWNDLFATASAPCSVPDLTDMDDDADGCVLAKAIASVRLHAANPASLQAQAMRYDVLAGLSQMMDEANWCDNGFCPPFDAFGVGDTRKTLAIGRNLGGYLAAAELIGISEADTPSRSDLIAFLEGTGSPADPEEIAAGILGYEWIDGGTYQLPLVRRTLREAHDERPNNWGGHACASLAAAAIFRQQSAELLQIHSVALGWLGACSAGDCSQFDFGAEAADWTCHQTAPSYGINEENDCIVDVDPSLFYNPMDLAGAQPDDMRRGGPFPAGCNASPRACAAEVHIWGGLQGRITCAYILRRQGFDLFSPGTAALRRSYAFQHQPIWEIAGVPGQPHPPHLSQDGTPNDDAYLAYIVNHAYGTSFPLDPAAGGPGYHDVGKGFGWTRYTLGEHACSVLAADSNFDGVCDAAAVPGAPRHALAVGGLLLLIAARALLARTRATARSGR